MPLPPYPPVNSGTFESQSGGVFPLLPCCIPYSSGSTYEIYINFLPSCAYYRSESNAPYSYKEGAPLGTEESDGLPSIE